PLQRDQLLVAAVPDGGHHALVGRGAHLARVRRPGGIGRRPLAQPLVGGGPPLLLPPARPVLAELAAVASGRPNLPAHLEIPCRNYRPVQAAGAGQEWGSVEVGRCEVWRYESVSVSEGPSHTLTLSYL